MAHSPGSPHPTHGGYDSARARALAEGGDDWVARVAVGDWVEVEDHGGIVAGEVVHVGTSSSSLDPAGTRYARVRRSAGRSASEVDVAPPWQRLVRHDPGYRARASALALQRGRKTNRSGSNRARNRDKRVVLKLLDPRHPSDDYLTRLDDFIGSWEGIRGAWATEKQSSAVVRWARRARAGESHDFVVGAQGLTMTATVVPTAEGLAALDAELGPEIDYDRAGVGRSRGGHARVHATFAEAQAQAQARQSRTSEQTVAMRPGGTLVIDPYQATQATRTGAPNMSRTGVPAYKPATPRRAVGYSDSALRKRAKSLAQNLLGGMPDGRGGMTEWGWHDVERAYDEAVPPRWATAAIRLRSKYRLYYGPAEYERYAHGRPGTKEAERDYAAAILRILKSDTPEQTAERIAGEARTENRAAGVVGNPTRKLHLVSTKDVDFGEYKLIYLGDPSRGMASKYDRVWGVVTYGGKVVRGPATRDDVRQIVERASGKHEEDLPHPKDWILGRNEASGSSFDPSPLRRIKVITSHAGKGRFLRETEGFGGSLSEWVKGYVPRQRQIPSPYAYSPVDAVHVTREGAFR